MSASRQALGAFAWMLILLLVEIIVIGSMLPIDTIEKTGQIEANMVQQFLGEDSAEVLKEKADDIYDSLFNKTGLVAESFTTFIPSQEAKAKSRGLEKLSEKMFQYVESKLTAFWTAAYLAVHRIMSLWIWLPGFTPVIAAMVFDARCRRRIKQLTFATSSAMIYGASKTTFLGTLIGPVMYALFPFPVPPQIALLWCVCITLSIGGMVTHWPRT